MYSSVTIEAAPQKTSVMKKVAVVGLFMGCMAMAFMAGTKYTSYTQTNSVMNGMLEGEPAASTAELNYPLARFGNDPGSVEITSGYFWIVANAKSAFEGILEDPNDALNWDAVAKAYCNVVKMYCAYVPYCADDGCRPDDIREEWNYFCKQGPPVEGGDAVNGPFEKSMKFKACTLLDYVNGPAGAR